MPSTSLLGLALPVTGTTNWGPVVNDSITSLVDSAIAGTTTLSTDADVTLSVTSEAANQARQAIILCTGARTLLRTITAPAQSKTYVVINNTTGGFGVQLVGVGPTSGVVIPNGKSAFVAWDGSDFKSAVFFNAADIVGTLAIANGGTGQTTANAAFNALAPNQAAASGKYLKSDGTNASWSAINASTGDVTGVLPSSNGGTGLSSFAANQVFYASSSSAVAQSSNLTFDGSTLAVNSVSVGRGAGGVSSNTAVGSGVLSSNTSGQENTAIGNNALNANTTGESNVAVGGSALTTNTNQFFNTAVGFQSAQFSKGAENTSVGYRSFRSSGSATTNARFNTSVGFQTLSSNSSGANNVAVGAYSMELNGTGGSNTSIGYGAMRLSSAATNNVAVGVSALSLPGFASEQVAIGNFALTFLQGVGNVGVGYYALAGSGAPSSSDGSYNVAVGNAAMLSIRSGDENVAVGYRSALNNEDGNYNVAIGSHSLEGNTTGNDNIAIGYYALSKSTTVSGNVAVGLEAGENVEAARNTAVGYRAIQGDIGGSSGTDNVAQGYGALIAVSTGSNNVAIGSGAGDAITTGSGNVCVGKDSEASIGSSTNEIVIGNGVLGQGGSNVTLGSSAGKIYNAYTVNATWTQTSDATLKNVIGPDALGLSFVNRLKPIKFTWKPSNELSKDSPYYRDQNERVTDVVIHGFVAQDVKTAMDAEGCTTFNGWDQGPDGIQAISREMFISPLVNAVNELTDMVKKLTVRIEELESK